MYVINRSRRDLNLDSWIQSPKCLPLHHDTRYNVTLSFHCVINVFILEWKLFHKLKI